MSRRSASHISSSSSTLGVTGIGGTIRGRLLATNVFVVGKACNGVGGSSSYGFWAHLAAFAFEMLQFMAFAYNPYVEGNYGSQSVFYAIGLFPWWDLNFSSHLSVGGFLALFWIVSAIVLFATFVWSVGMVFPHFVSANILVGKLHLRFLIDAAAGLFFVPFLMTLLAVTVCDTSLYVPTSLALFANSNVRIVQTTSVLDDDYTLSTQTSSSSSSRGGSVFSSNSRSGTPTVLPGSTRIAGSTTTIANSILSAIDPHNDEMYLRAQRRHPVLFFLPQETCGWGSVTVTDTARKSFASSSSSSSTSSTSSSSSYYYADDDDAEGVNAADDDGTSTATEGRVPTVTISYLGANNTMLAHKVLGIIFAVLLVATTYLRQSCVALAELQPLLAFEVGNNVGIMAALLAKVGLAVAFQLLISSGHHGVYSIIVAAVLWAMAVIHIVFLPFMNVVVHRVTVSLFVVFGWLSMSSFIAAMVRSGVENDPPFVAFGGLYVTMVAGVIVLGALSFFYLATIRLSRKTQYLLEHVLKPGFVHPRENPFFVSCYNRDPDSLPYPRRLPETDYLFSPFRHLEGEIVEEGLAAEERVFQQTANEGRSGWQDREFVAAVARRVAAASRRRAAAGGLGMGMSGVGARGGLGASSGGGGGGGGLSMNMSTMMRSMLNGAAGAGGGNPLLASGAVPAGGVGGGPSLMGPSSSGGGAAPMGAGNGGAPPTEQELMMMMLEDDDWMGHGYGGYYYDRFVDDDDGFGSSLRRRSAVGFGGGGGFGDSAFMSPKMRKLRKQQQKEQQQSGKQQQQQSASGDQPQSPGGATNTNASPSSPAAKGAGDGPASPLFNYPAHPRYQHTSRRSMLKSALRIQVMSPTIDTAMTPYDAEISVRFLYEWHKLTGRRPTPHMLSFACRIFAKFLMKFPQSGVVYVSFVRFLTTFAPSKERMRLCIDVLDSISSKASLLLLPELYEIFILSLSATDTLGERDRVHLQLYHRVRLLHKRALVDTASFWRSLLEDTVLLQRNGVVGIGGGINLLAGTAGPTVSNSGGGGAAAGSPLSGGEGDATDNNKSAGGSKGPDNSKSKKNKKDSGNNATSAAEGGGGGGGSGGNATVVPIFSPTGGHCAAAATAAPVSSASSIASAATNVSQHATSMASTAATTASASAGGASSSNKNAKPSTPQPEGGKGAGGGALSNTNSNGGAAAGAAAALTVGAVSDHNNTRQANALLISNALVTLCHFATSLCRQRERAYADYIATISVAADDELLYLSFSDFCSDVLQNHECAEICRAESRHVAYQKRRRLFEGVTGYGSGGGGGGRGGAANASDIYNDAISTFFGGGGSSGSGGSGGNRGGSGGGNAGGAPTARQRQQSSFFGLYGGGGANGGLDADDYYDDDTMSRAPSMMGGGGGGGGRRASQFNAHSSNGGAFSLRPSLANTGNSTTLMGSQRNAWVGASLPAIMASLEEQRSRLASHVNANSLRYTVFGVLFAMLLVAGMDIAVVITQIQSQMRNAKRLHLLGELRSLTQTIPTRLRQAIDTIEGTDFVRTAEFEFRFEAFSTEVKRFVAVNAKVTTGSDGPTGSGALTALFEEPIAFFRVIKDRTPPSLSTTLSGSSGGDGSTATATSAVYAPLSSQAPPTNAQYTSTNIIEAAVLIAAMCNGATTALFQTPIPSKISVLNDESVLFVLNEVPTKGSIAYDILIQKVLEMGQDDVSTAQVAISICFALTLLVLVLCYCAFVLEFRKGATQKEKVLSLFFMIPPEAMRGLAEDAKVRTEGFIATTAAVTSVSHGYQSVDVVALVGGGGLMDTATAGGGAGTGGLGGGTLGGGGGGFTPAAGGMAPSGLTPVTAELRLITSEQQQMILDPRSSSNHNNTNNNNKNANNGNGPANVVGESVFFSSSAIDAATAAAVRGGEGGAGAEIATFPTLFDDPMFANANGSPAGTGTSPNSGGAANTNKLPTINVTAASMFGASGSGATGSNSTAGVFSGLNPAGGAANANANATTAGGGKGSPSNNNPAGAANTVGVSAGTAELLATASATGIGVTMLRLQRQQQASRMGGIGGGSSSLSAFNNEYISLSASGALGISSPSSQQFIGIGSPSVGGAGSPTTAAFGGGGGGVGGGPTMHVTLSPRNLKRAAGGNSASVSPASPLLLGGLVGAGISPAPVVGAGGTSAFNTNNNSSAYTTSLLARLKEKDAALQASGARSRSLTTTTLSGSGGGGGGGGGGGAVRPPMAAVPSPPMFAAAAAGAPHSTPQKSSMRTGSLTRRSKGAAVVTVPPSSSIADDGRDGVRGSTSVLIPQQRSARARVEADESDSDDGEDDEGAVGEGVPPLPMAAPTSIRSALAGNSNKGSLAADGKKVKSAAIASSTTATPHGDGGGNAPPRGSTPPPPPSSLSLNGGVPPPTSTRRSNTTSSTASRRSASAPPLRSKASSAASSNKSKKKSSAAPDLLPPPEDEASSFLASFSSSFFSLASSSALRGATTFHIASLILLVAIAVAGFAAASQHYASGGVREEPIVLSENAIGCAYRLSIITDRWVSSTNDFVATASYGKYRLAMDAYDRWQSARWCVEWEGSKILHESDAGKSDRGAQPQGGGKTPSSLTAGQPATSAYSTARAGAYSATSSTTSSTTGFASSASSVLAGDYFFFSDAIERSSMIGTFLGARVAGFDDMLAPEVGGFKYRRPNKTASLSSHYDRFIEVLHESHAKVIVDRERDDDDDQEGDDGTPKKKSSSSSSNDGGGPFFDISVSASSSKQWVAYDSDVTDVLKPRETLWDIALRTSMDVYFAADFYYYRAVVGQLFHQVAMRYGEDMVSYVVEERVHIFIAGIAYSLIAIGVTLGCIGFLVNASRFRRRSGGALGDGSGGPSSSSSSTAYGDEASSALTSSYAREYGWAECDSDDEDVFDERFFTSATSKAAGSSSKSSSSRGGKHQHQSRGGASSVSVASVGSGRSVWRRRGVCAVTLSCMLIVAGCIVTVYFSSELFYSGVELRDSGHTAYSQLELFSGIRRVESIVRNARMFIMTDLHPSANLKDFIMLSSNKISDSGVSDSIGSEQYSSTAASSTQHYSNRYDSFDSYPEEFQLSTGGLGILGGDGGLGRVSTAASPVFSHRLETGSALGRGAGWYQEDVIALRPDLNLGTDPNYDPSTGTDFSDYTAYLASSAEVKRIATIAVMLAASAVVDNCSWYVDAAKAWEEERLNSLSNASTSSVGGHIHHSFNVSASNNTNTHPKRSKKASVLELAPPTVQLLASLFGSRLLNKTASSGDFIDSLLWALRQKGNLADGGSAGSAVGVSSSNRSAAARYTLPYPSTLVFGTLKYDVRAEPTYTTDYLSFSSDYGSTTGSGATSATGFYTNSSHDLHSGLLTPNQRIALASRIITSKRFSTLIETARSTGASEAMRVLQASQSSLQPAKDRHDRAARGFFISATVTFAIFIIFAMLLCVSYVSAFSTTGRQRIVYREVYRVIMLKITVGLCAIGAIAIAVLIVCLVMSSQSFASQQQTSLAHRYEWTTFAARRAAQSMAEAEEANSTMAAAKAQTTITIALNQMQLAEHNVFFHPSIDAALRSSIRTELVFGPAAEPIPSSSTSSSSPSSADGGGGKPGFTVRDVTSLSGGSVLSIVASQSRGIATRDETSPLGVCFASELSDQLGNQIGLGIQSRRLRSPMFGLMSAPVSSSSSTSTSSASSSLISGRGGISVAKTVDDGTLSFGDTTGETLIPAAVFDLFSFRAASETTRRTTNAVRGFMIEFIDRIFNTSSEFLDVRLAIVIIMLVVLVVVILAVFAFVLWPEAIGLIREDVGVRTLLLQLPRAVSTIVPEISDFFEFDSTNKDDILKKKLQQSEKLLQSILPPVISRRLKNGETAIADNHPEVTVVFAALVGLDLYTAAMGPRSFVSFLNSLMVMLDRVVDTLLLEKIKTIGDVYFLCGGLTRKTHKDHALRCVECSLFFMEVLFEHNNRHRTPLLSFRIGVNTGPAVAGVIGSKKVAFDIWGDSVNTASRMQSTGKSGEIQLSQSTYNLVKDRYVVLQRSVVAKGKGALDTFVVVERSGGGSGGMGSSDSYSWRDNQ